MPVGASAEFDPETRNSVVVVNTCLDLDGGVFSFGWGTGFFVGEPGEDPTYLITNHHVIEPFLENGAGELVQAETTTGVLTGRSKIRVYYSSTEFEEAYTVAYDSSKDLAVLKLGAPTSKRKPLTLCSPSDSMVGSEVYAVGYPGLAENVFADATTTWGPSDVSVTSGSVSRLLTTSGTGQMLLQIDCVIRPGNSGGPVVNSDGQVVGVAVSSVSNEEAGEVYYAVNIDEVIPYLKQYDVPYVEGPQETVAETEGTLSRDAAQSGDLEAAQPVVTTPETSDSQGVPTALWIVIGVAVVAVAAVVIFLLLRKNGKTAAAQSAPKFPLLLFRRHPKRRRFFVLWHSSTMVCVSPFKGVKSLSGTSQTECQVVFRPGTPGVSRRHCSITWDEASGDFILTDLGSSFGTFLENNQRLSQGVPYRLRAGDRFYLGAAENLMSVNVE